MFSVNFNNIRPINGSANDGFEEFVCQLARKETIPTSASFVRNGKPDGGVECYHILQDHSIVAWQAKYFIKSFETSQYQQIDDSVKTALKSYPKLTRYIIAVPIDPSDVHIKGKKSMKDRINEYLQTIYLMENKILLNSIRKSMQESAVQVRCSLGRTSYATTRELALQQVGMLLKAKEMFQTGK